MKNESRSFDERERCKQELAAVIEGLPPELQQVFVLSYIQRKRRATVAVELGIDVPAVEALQTKSLAMCRARMAERSGGDDGDDLEKILPTKWPQTPNVQQYREWLRGQSALSIPALFDV